MKSIKSVNQESKFDCIHLLNQITYRQPGRFHKLGIPFFWGPTGGSETISKSFIKSLPIGLRIIEFLRLYVTKFLHIALRNVHDAAKHSSVIYAFTNLDHDFFSNYAITKKWWMPPPQLKKLRQGNSFRERLGNIVGRSAYRQKAPFLDSRFNEEIP